MLYRCVSLFLFMVVCCSSESNVKLLITVSEGANINFSLNGFDYALSSSKSGSEVTAVDKQIYVLPLADSGVLSKLWTLTLPSRSGLVDLLMIEDVPTNVGDDLAIDSSQVLWSKRYKRSIDISRDWDLTVGLKDGALIRSGLNDNVLFVSKEPDYLLYASNTITNVRFITMPEPPGLLELKMRDGAGNLVRSIFLEQVPGEVDEEVVFSPIGEQTSIAWSGKCSIEFVGNFPDGQGEMVFSEVFVDFDYESMSGDNTFDLTHYSKRPEWNNAEPVASVDDVDVAEMYAQLELLASGISAGQWDKVSDVFGVVNMDVSTFSGSLSHEEANDQMLTFFSAIWPEGNANVTYVQGVEKYVAKKINEKVFKLCVQNEPNAQVISSPIGVYKGVNNEWSAVLYFSKISGRWVVVK